MIHVAPCDCELHVRIRELEAELATKVENWYDKCEELVREKASAEKAETERDELQAYIDKFGWNSDVKERIADVKRWEARVTELEAEMACAYQQLDEAETELAGTQSTVRTLLDERHEQLVRAEKAEKLLDDHRRLANSASCDLCLKERALKAEARVAELERIIGEAHEREAD